VCVKIASYDFAIILHEGHNIFVVKFKKAPMYLFIFFIIFFLLVFVLRWKVFGFISSIELIIISIYAFVPSWHKYLLPFWYLENETLVYIGWALLILSLVLIWFAQTNMKDSWRIGIDEKNKTELVTDGFFSISRNPIFLGIMIANVGSFNGKC